MARGPPFSRGLCRTLFALARIFTKIILVEVRGGCHVKSLRDNVARVNGVLFLVHYGL